MMRGRYVIILVLVLSLLASAFAREVAQRWRTVPEGARAPAAGGTGLAAMNSFAIALLLGGLRGPLVMILWTSSEAQKADRQLEDFDTRVEWIRLLQPEFDTVHIFQIWNKAYNISVQMASLANKYSTILDAIDYARSVDAERPNNINILAAIGGVYFDKLGNSAEKPYYRRRIRQETLPQPQVERLQRTDPRWRRIHHDTLLDERGYILPEHRDELRHLTEMEPFPYGLSTLALGYNYYKRAQILQTEGGQRHAQLSELVIDSRPALALNHWSDDERERGRRAELRAFGLPVPPEVIDLELPTASISIDYEVADPAALEEAIFSYAKVQELIELARVEYERHLRYFDINLHTYIQHLNTLRAREALAAADLAYLRAVQSQGQQRTEFAQQARQLYQRAAEAKVLLVLRHYTDGHIQENVFPQGYRSQNIEQLSPQQHFQIMERTRQFIAQRGWDPHEEDRQEYENYLQRIQYRLRQLGAA